MEPIFKIGFNPAVQDVLCEAIREGAANLGSRVLAANFPAHEELEFLLATSFGSEDAFSLPNGYLAACEALRGMIDVVCIDEHAHISSKEVVRQLQCPVTYFKHLDLNSLTDAASNSGGGQKRIFVVTDGVFSHNGFLAPLKAYLDILSPGGKLLIADTHGVGVLGDKGQGVLELS